MEPLLPFLIPATVAALAAYYFKKNRELGSAFERIARRFEGSVDPGGWFSVPRVIFNATGTKAPAALTHTYSQRRNQPDSLEFWAPLKNADWSVQVRPQTAADAFGRMVGLQDVRIGRTPFDERFVVKSNRELEAIAYLTKDAVLSAFEHVAPGPTPAVELRIGAGGFFVTRPIYGVDEALMCRFLEQAVVLYRQLPPSFRFDLAIRS